MLILDVLKGRYKLTTPIAVCLCNNMCTRWCTWLQLEGERLQGSATKWQLSITMISTGRVQDHSYPHAKSSDKPTNLDVNQSFFAI